MDVYQMLIAQLLLITTRLGNYRRFLGLDTGIIINVNDICAWNSIDCNRPVSSSYLTSKTALRNLTDNLRIELARMHSNVKVIVSFALMQICANIETEISILYSFINYRASFLDWSILR